MNLTTYLNFGGNCAEAFHFYEQHLGGKITGMRTFAQMPAPNPGEASAAMDRDKILHAQILIAGTELMGSDAPPDRYQPMRSGYLMLGVDSAAEVDRIYALLSEGGEIFMPVQKTFFSERFAMLRDRFGVAWMLNVTPPAA